jgi:hypothetical protein
MKMIEPLPSSVNDDTDKDYKRQKNYRWFPAKHSSRCSNCGGYIMPGDLITKTVHGSCVCDNCEIINGESYDYT